MIDGLRREVNAKDVSTMEQVKRQDNYIVLWRGISAQMVVVGHSLNLFYPKIMMNVAPNGQIHGLKHILYIQSLGVVIFFLISGYIVTKTSLGKTINGKYDVTDFLIDRGTRIFTPFIPAALLIFAFDYLFFVDWQVGIYQNIHLDLATLLANCLMIFNNPILGVVAHVTHQNWIYFGRIGTAQPFWSIVIEWWIYVTFGIFAIRWVIQRKLGWISLGIFLFAIVYPSGELIKGMALPLAWVFGSLYCIGEDQVRKIPYLALLIAALICAAMAGAALYHAQYDVYDGIFTCTFSTAFLLCHRLLDDVISGGRRRLPAIFNLWSDYSYSLYLVHFSILIYLQILWPRTLSPVLAVATGVVGTNLVAYAFWRLIELRHTEIRRYAHRLRDRLRGRQKSVLGLGG